MLPSELIGVLREGGKRWLLDTGREEKKKVLDWCDEHALDLDREYLQTQIASEEKRIEETQKRLRDLRLQLAGVEEEIAEQAAEHGEFPAEPAKGEG